MRNQRADWHSTLTDSWWGRREHVAVTEGRPRVAFGVGQGRQGRRPVYAHRVHWVWLCWGNYHGAPFLVRTVAGWKCRLVSRNATLCRERPAELEPCPKCELAIQLEGSPTCAR